MQRAENISKLIEEVSSAIIITDAANCGDIKNLRQLLGRIQQEIDSDGTMAKQLLMEAGRITSAASTHLETITSQSQQDAKTSLELVTKQVCELQQLIEQGVAGDSKQEQDAGEAQTVLSGDDASLALDFITEAREHIENAEGGLLVLETNAGDSESLNLIFRAFHTIKGMAGFLNLKEIQSLSHAAENLLDKARKGAMVLQGPSMDAVFSALDALKKMTGTLKESIDSQTPVQKFAGLEQLIAELAATAEGQKAPAAAANQTQKENSEKPVLPPTAAVTDSAQNTSEHTPSSAKGTDEKVKVSLGRLDSLVNMIGELVIAQSMISQQIDKEFSSEHDLSRKVGHQSKIIREIQELSMAMRMIPIQGLFQKMARLVRDLSHKAGKNVEFETSGEETEIDRNIVDLLADPLVHMIRNSVDHGLEDSEARRAAGKKEAGKIILRAYHKGGNIVIELCDDGKGLNKQKILKKALDSGIIQYGQDLSEQEIFKLIFQAGLSTAEKVTDISGRGVGMDVVRKNIEALRGRIEISSEEGKGAVFTIKLPLTLAIIDGLLVSAGKQKFIIPIMSVEHSVRPKAGDISTVHNKGELVNVRGALLPIIRLHRVFKIESSKERLEEASLVVIEGETRKCGLMVDEILGQQQVVIKSLGEGMACSKGISGAAIMGDGSISLILDAAGLMSTLQA